MSGSLRSVTGQWSKNIVGWRPMPLAVVLQVEFDVVSQFVLTTGCGNALFDINLFGQVWAEVAPTVRGTFDREVVRHDLPEETYITLASLPLRVRFSLHGLLNFSQAITDIYYASVACKFIWLSLADPGQERVLSVAGGESDPGRYRCPLSPGSYFGLLVRDSSSASECRAVRGRTRSSDVHRTRLTVHSSPSLGSPG